MDISHNIRNKYSVGCECCRDFVPFLERQYWKHRFFRKTDKYDFYFGEIATQDNMSLGKRPTLPNRISKRYSGWTKNRISSTWLMKISYPWII